MLQKAHDSFVAYLSREQIMLMCNKNNLRSCFNFRNALTFHCHLMMIYIYNLNHNMLGELVKDLIVTEATIDPLLVQLSEKI
jgi:hypothetical protein